MKNQLHTNFFTCLFVAFVITMPTHLSAQSWGFRAGYGSTTGTDRISGLALDAAGNLYATGSFTGTIDFGTGVMTATGNLDGFVAKFSPSGVCQWAIKFNGPGTAQDQGLGIATNGTSVFVGGVYQTSLSINGAAAITGYGGIDGFGFKLDAATGATQWATVFGSGSTDAVQAMCIDNTGNMYVTGYFSSNATYPTATFGSFTRSTNGGTGTDAYVAKLDGTTGTVSWVSNGGMSGYNDNVSNSGLAYAPAQDAIVMVGSAQAPSAGTTFSYNTVSPASSVSLTTAGGLDVVVLELSASTGAFQSGLLVGGAASSNEEALAATYDPSSQLVCMTGYFNTSALTFGSNPTINPIGSDDIFYAAYNPATNTFAWSKSAGSTIQDRGQSITANGTGKVVITGRYRNTMTAPTATTPLSITSSRTSSADEIYMLRVNSQTGNAELLLTPVGDATITTGDIGTGLAASGALGKTWLGGMFGGTINLPPLPSLTTSGGTTADVLLASYDEPASLAVHLLSFAAQRVSNDIRLTWVTAAEQNNDHFEIERSNDGRNFSVVGQRTAGRNAVEGNYTWTDPSLTARTGNFYYRLKIVSLTGEITYSPVVIVDLGSNAAMVTGISPNPFTGPLNIHFNLPKESDVVISIADMNGRKLISQKSPVAQGFSTLAIPSSSGLNKGVYMVSVECAGKIVTQKVMKQ